MLFLGPSCFLEICVVFFKLIPVKAPPITARTPVFQGFCWDFLLGDFFRKKKSQKTKTRDRFNQIWLWPVGYHPKTDPNIATRQLSSQFFGFPTRWTINPLYLAAIEWLNDFCIKVILLGRYVMNYSIANVKSSFRSICIVNWYQVIQSDLLIP